MLTNKEAYIEMVKGNKVWMPNSPDKFVYRIDQYYNVWYRYLINGKPKEETSKSFCHLNKDGWEIYRDPINYINFEEAITAFKKGRKIAHECPYRHEYIFGCDFDNNHGIALDDKHEHTFKIGCIKSEKWFILD